MLLVESRNCLLKHRGIEYAKLAVETCVFPVWEAVNGQYKLSTPSKLFALAPQKKKPVVDYLQGQGRFRHMFKPQGKELLKEIQTITDERWQRLLKKCSERLKTTEAP